MCLDFPGRVVERNGDTVVVECEGRRRRASMLVFPDLAVGDWVFVAFGTVIERLDDDTAEAISNELAIAKGVAP
ncbi:MAG TPA: HypC/HybG/HupF family hydrogenase formation chaperone [Candidatus Limnocylindrales bacterium]|nr:HypC/HybG/HupF family hydrogenase formation chaperone [Candidatus Limnocylindrales bacterium]